MTAARATNPTAALAIVLDSTPGYTAAELATIAGIGKSTAGKLLAAWEKDGTAVRTTPEKGAATWARPAPKPVVVDADQDAADWLNARHAEATATRRESRVGTIGKMGLPVLGRNGLRAAVEGFLAENADAEHTAFSIAKQLDGRSPGAVANVLRKLADEGLAVRTSTKPLRYRAV